MNILRCKVTRRQTKMQILLWRDVHRIDSRPLGLLGSPSNHVPLDISSQLDCRRLSTTALSRCHRNDAEYPDVRLCASASQDQCFLQLGWRWPGRSIKECAIHSKVLYRRRRHRCVRSSAERAARWGRQALERSGSVSRRERMAATGLFACRSGDAISVQRVSVWNDGRTKRNASVTTICLTQPSLFLSFFLYTLTLWSSPILRIVLFIVQNAYSSKHTRLR
jgi:hypothetical protein